MFEDKLKVSGNTMIKKSIEIAKAPMQLVELNKGLNVRQQRFFNMAILALGDVEGISEFGKKEYSEIFKDDSDKFFAKTVKDDVRALGKLAIQESTEDIEAWTNIFMRVEYDKKDKKYRFYWSPLMMEKVKDIRKNYIYQDLQILAKFKNKYSFIWYDFFKSNYRQWKWTISKKDLIHRLRLEDKKSYLKNHSMLYKQCIVQPLEELNEFTEYKVSCKLIKHKKSIVGYEFIRATVKDVEIGVTDKQINILKEIVERYNDTTAVLNEIKDFIITDPNRATMLTELFMKIQGYKNEIALASESTMKDFIPVIEDAIKADNEYKKILEVAKLNQRPEPQKSQKPKVEFYNWLEERED